MAIPQLLDGDAILIVRGNFWILSIPSSIIHSFLCASALAVAGGDDGVWLGMLQITQYAKPEPLLFAFGTRLRLQAQVLLYVLGQGIIDFAVARYGLFLSGDWIVVDVVASAVPQKNTALLL